MRAARAQRPQRALPPYRVRSTVQPPGANRHQQQQQPLPTGGPALNGIGAGARMGQCHSQVQGHGWALDWDQEVMLCGTTAFVTRGMVHDITTDELSAGLPASHLAPPPQQQHPAVSDPGPPTPETPAEVRNPLPQRSPVPAHAPLLGSLHSRWYDNLKPERLQWKNVAGVDSRRARTPHCRTCCRSGGGHWR